jgi:hypothetical protein
MNCLKKNGNVRVSLASNAKWNQCKQLKRIEGKQKNRNKKRRFEIAEKREVWEVRKSREMGV